ncbi:MAG: deoxyribodipyrimidine photo-lyase [Gammaproteobacteria bacterium]|nr:deoxyribodipyrimidine photo-lyase [Gammaproteobacteria bacterium]
MKKSLVWFRNDLRVTDNAALYQASLDSVVIGVYVEATEQRITHNDSASKIGFTYDSLLALKEDLRSLNIPLHIITVSDYSEIPQKLLSLSEKYQVSSISFNKEYLVDEVARDFALEKLVSDKGIEIKSYDCDLILPPSSVRKAGGEPYRVFTPYKKAWIEQHKQKKPVSWPAPSKQDSDVTTCDVFESDFAQDYRRDIWQAGSQAARRRLEKFISTVTDYSQDRDIPSIVGTSLVSPHLTVGTISAQQCTERLYDFYNGDELSFYKDTWLSELIWRDFYRQIVIDNPEIVKHLPYKENASEPWENNFELFSAWCKGQTGFPIIDAAMRQLNQTGWMHNRLRMNAAMFLNKLCLVDWRWGEKYFMQTLIDGDFASNNGGWQWCSSTGADSAPYFRIMNPTAQSKRFDPHGAFIKKLVPELTELDSKSIHEPSAEQRKACNYPMPIINYKEARKRAISLLA